MDPEIVELLRKPTLTVKQYRRVVGTGHNATYEAVERGEIEGAFRVGKRILIPTRPLRQKLGLDAV